jgi:hypothetical protein
MALSAIASMRIFGQLSLGYQISAGPHQRPSPHHVAQVGFKRSGYRHGHRSTSICSSTPSLALHHKSFSTVLLTMYEELFRSRSVPRQAHRRPNGSIHTHGRRRPRMAICKKADRIIGLFAGCGDDGQDFLSVAFAHFLEGSFKRVVPQRFHLFYGWIL